MNTHYTNHSHTHSFTCFNIIGHLILIFEYLQ